MRRSFHGPAAATAAIALAVLAAAAAAATPPTSQAALSRMTLQGSDLAPGAAVTTAYGPSGNGFPPSLDRAFGVATTKAGFKLEGIVTEIDATRTARAALGYLDTRREIYGGTLGPTYLGADLAAGVGRMEALIPTRIHFGKLHAIAAGRQGWLVAGMFSAAGATFAVDELDLVVAGVNASLTVVAAGPSLPESVSLTLARTVAAHIASVVGSK
jgi:hypothetical protein